MTCDDKQHEQMAGVFSRIVAEMERQRALHPADHIGHSCWYDADRLAILTAEVGEVASEVTEGMTGNASAQRLVEEHVKPCPVEGCQVRS